MSNTIFIKNSLKENGYAFLKKFTPETSTLDLASSIGKPIDISSFAPHYKLRVVQELRPKALDVAFSNHYHGNFGLNEYPAHSDLAHWNKPPRFLLLRSKIGTRGVATHIYTTQDLQKAIPTRLARDALFIPRKNASKIIPLPMMVSRTMEFSLRWDSLFLTPINRSSKQCEEIIKSIEFQSIKKEIILAEPGDTLIIDNWTALHGRGVVPQAEKFRILERVYLEEIYE
ncbi:unnamed protein product [Brugia timori]|uniref:TauD domain-containing protein n=1 Tax=Brugia timori TaxID=42155 RepID=A0A0R3Q9P3_9BILA|nr:unnamed protein product [Brugia timori]